MVHIKCDQQMLMQIKEINLRRGQNFFSQDTCLDNILCQKLKKKKRKSEQNSGFLLSEISAGTFKVRFEFPSVVRFLEECQTKLKTIKEAVLLSIRSTKLCLKNFFNHYQSLFLLLFNLSSCTRKLGNKPLMVARADVV